MLKKILSFVLIVLMVNAIGVSSAYAGTNGDIPVPADYDGDTLADIVYFRPSNGVWYFINTLEVPFGSNEDIPIPGFLVVQ